MESLQQKETATPQPDRSELVKAVAEAFGAYDDRIDGPGRSSHMSLSSLSQRFGITATSARKLLITAGVYSTRASRTAARLRADGYTTEQIMDAMGLSYTTVHSYLPYVKPPYRRKASGERPRTPVSPAEEERLELLWRGLLSLQGRRFTTATGLAFTYTIRGGEMFVSRRSKSLTKATVILACRRALQLDGKLKGPKQLGTFGASYLYPVLMELGVIRSLPE